MINLYWFITQALSYFYSKSSAIQEVEATYPYREIGVPDHEKRMKIFHTSGFWMTMIFCIITSFSQPWVWMLPMIIINGLIYFIIFTINYNICIGKKWDYIGNTAKTDIMIRKYFGKKGMRIAIILSSIIILIINTLRIIFI